MASLGAANDISGTLCPRCTDKGTLTCSRCNDIKYCSAECQRADWATHKVLCGAIKDLGPRPSKDMRRILAFLPDEEKPRFVWAPLMQNLFSRHESVDISSFFEPAPMYRQKPQVKNPWTNGTLGYGLDILFDDDFSHAYSNDNRAVVAATKGANTFSWRGPIFAYCGLLGGGITDKRDIVDIRDMSMLGYAHVVANLTDYHNKDPRHALRKGPKIACVKVACDSDRLPNAPFPQAVQVPRSHPVFEREGCVSLVSELVGMPLATYKYPGSKSIAATDASNTIVSALHICCDLTSPECALPVQPFRSGDVGTQLVARADRTPLDCDTVEVFGKFCVAVVVTSLCMIREMFRDDGMARERLERMPKGLLADALQPVWADHFSRWKACKAAAAGAGTAGSVLGDADANVGAAENAGNDDQPEQSEST